MLPRQETLTGYGVTDWVATAFGNVEAEQGGDLRQARLMFLDKYLVTRIRSLSTTTNYDDCKE